MTRNFGVSDRSLMRFEDMIAEAMAKVRYVMVWGRRMTFTGRIFENSAKYLKVWALRIEIFETD